MINNQIKVIFVDDDTTLGNTVQMGLTYLGYKVHYQSSLIAMESIINEFQPNILILDVEIGDKDGIEDSYRIRTVFKDIPIIFASSHTDSSYTVKALDCGAVTYIKKPIDLEELSAYIKRYANCNNTSLAIGKFSLDLESRELINSENNSSNILNKKEFDLLKLLLKNKNTTVLRELIIFEIWDNDFSSEQILNNYISRLRKFLSYDNTVTIKTVTREGYKLTIKD